jgi:hypothetical protein
LKINLVGSQKSSAGSFLDMTSEFLDENLLIILAKFDKGCKKIKDGGRAS